MTQKSGAWYAASPLAYARRKTRVVKVGDRFIGGEHPILVQSMCTTDTLDTAATVAQSLRMVAAGCELVRITAQTPRHAANLQAIREGLWAAGCRTPIVADIHFMPEAAMVAALHVEKVRVNPGNFADTKRFAIKEYSDEQYNDEIKRIEERFSPLVLRCRQLGRAMRIGTNHGSLSDRIMNRYGDTPRGMVESALEFLRIGRSLDYHDMVLSMKSSNPKVMVQAYRLLVEAMDAEGMDYPLHLGVTEAGDGEDGRVKSMAGIASLLEDGLGDTVRVSLTEDPEFEMPVAYRIARRYPAQPARDRSFAEAGESVEGLGAAWAQAHPTDQFRRRLSAPCGLAPKSSLALGSASLVRVFTVPPHAPAQWQANLDWLRGYKRGPNERMIRPEILLFSVTDAEGVEGVNRLVPEALELKVPCVARFDLADAAELGSGCRAQTIAVRLPSGAPGPGARERFGRVLGQLRSSGQALLLELPQASWPDFLAALEPALAAVEESGPAEVALCVRGWDPSALIHLHRGLCSWADARGKIYPLLLAMDSEESAEELTLSASSLFGSLLLDGVGDGVLVETSAEGADTVGLSYTVLQSCGVRITKTDFVSCPSCGRTLFDLQEVTARIKKRTGHLVGVKIAIMGCIVNGPGEMADADFGYVGGAPDMINLYVGKDCVARGIPMAEADGRLVELIKANGKWTEPEAA
ncbi:MAG TPA: (E)-4-hydroxy-3-methylbut-2-enyl-diphosphate synthase [bacterium]|nr:(E)-4-hydroxy-3-methylbut-2-enyl-diphosphate synthase [bacterium]